MTAPSSSTVPSLTPAEPPTQSTTDPRAEILSDWQWIYNEIGQGRFDSYRGQHIAVVNRTVLDHGEDQFALRQSVAARLALDPSRVVVFYIDG